LLAHPEAVNPEIFGREFFSDIKPRRPLWQLMLGGVFDRHPDLELVLTEIRADWIPATLRRLDTVFEKHREHIPARRTPSEYWHGNCLVGASFIHKAEVEMRHEIGIETISFGRDYPHPESTWPNTRDWLKDAFVGVPEDEMRMMLGENAIRFLNLDRERLGEITRRIGPTVEEVTGGGDVDAALIDNFAMRGGYLKPAEGEAKLPLVDQLLDRDLAGMGARS